MDSPSVLGGKQERTRKKKSACSARNDNVVAADSSVLVELRSSQGSSSRRSTRNDTIWEAARRGGSGKWVPLGEGRFPLGVELKLERCRSGAENDRST